METSRFFVANLPTNTTERDLKTLFQDYGQINNIELKTKENLVDPNDVKIIAFVTLNIGANEAQNSLNDLNWQKLHGQKIKVSLAKESFLERLKREREEAQSVASAAKPLTETAFEQQSDLLKLPQENKRKIFDVDAELDDDDDVAPELMISKKRAASSVHNGKIVIQNLDVEPLHIIETKHKKKKQMDTKSSSADQKRKESLNKMKNQYEQNKIAIQQALKGENKLVNKIKFNDAECETRDEKNTSRKEKTDIFGSDGESEDEYNGFDSATMGKKGEKLARMQAKQSLDPRFRIDAKFVDEDENDEQEKSYVADEGEPENERQWQMNILEQVVGRKLDTVKSADKLKQQNKKMLRYDPSKDEHQKFERSTKEDTQIKKPKQNENKTNKNASQSGEVSKELFYVVSDTLQESLRNRGEGFSLLNMFGRDEQLQRHEQLKQLGKEKILVNSNKSLIANPFNYDSSSDSEDEEDLIQEQEENVEAKKKPVQNEKQDVKNSKKKPKLIMESFFIPKNDIRLKEGAKFFIYRKSEDTVNENYEDVRNRLKLLIKTKITKTKKNLVNAGYKGKRKV